MGVQEAEENEGRRRQGLEYAYLVLHSETTELKAQLLWTRLHSQDSVRLRGSFGLWARLIPPGPERLDTAKPGDTRG